jgi:hypothetical protein
MGSAKEREEQWVVGRRGGCKLRRTNRLDGNMDVITSHVLLRIGIIQME